MDINAYALSVLRTVAALAAGYVITFLVAHGLNLDDSITNGITGLIYAALTAGYYVVARFLETFVHRYFGWLLLAPSPPAYPHGGGR